MAEVISWYESDKMWLVLPYLLQKYNHDFSDTVVD